MIGRAIAAATLLLALTAAPASADPAVPQPGSPCSPRAVGAFTTTTDATLECTPAGWEQVATPYPFSDEWVTLGPPVKLHGNGLRNAQLGSGAWTGTPLEPGATCAVQQVAVIRGVGAGPPVTLKAAPGQPLSFTTPELLFSAEFSGACLWQHR